MEKMIAIRASSFIINMPFMTQASSSSTSQIANADNQHKQLTTETTCNDIFFMFITYELEAKLTAK